MDERESVKGKPLLITSDKLRRFTREDYFNFALKMVQDFFEAKLDLPPWLSFRTDVIEDVYYGPKDLRYWYGTEHRGFWIREREEIMDPRGHGTAVTFRKVETFGYRGGFSVEYALHLDRPDEVKWEAKAPNEKVAKDLGVRFQEFFSHFPELSPKAHFKELMWKLRNTFAQDNGQVGIQLAKEALEINPKNIEARFWLGCAYSVANQNTEAIEQFSQVVKVNPNHQDAYYNLGLSYYQIQNYDKAFEVLKMGLAIDPDNHPILYWLGACQEALGNLTKALDYYQQAIKTAPEKSQWWVPGKSFLREAEAALQRLQKV